MNLDHCWQHFTFTCMCMFIRPIKTGIPLSFPLCNQWETRSFAFTVSCVILHAGCWEKERSVLNIINCVLFRYRELYTDVFCGSDNRNLSRNAYPKEVFDTKITGPPGGRQLNKQVSKKPVRKRGRFILGDRRQSVGLNET